MLTIVVSRNARNVAPTVTTTTARNPGGSTAVDPSAPLAAFAVVPSAPLAAFALDPSAPLAAFAAAAVTPPARRNLPRARVRA